MEPVLLLVHRLPYPPNKGDKIRSYNLLKFLSSRYEVHLATFIDDPYDWKYTEKVKSLCKSTLIRSQNKKISTLKSLTGFITGKALSLSFYADSQIKKWCNKTISSHNIKKAIVFSSPMAQFIENDFNDMIKIIDFVDIDSDKWHQYSQSKTWPLSWVYRREARKLFNYECKITREFNKSLFVSAAESEMFKEMCPAYKNKISYFDNGVDLDYFNFDDTLLNPYDNHKIISFAGAMDYWANVDAVVWFAKHIFPDIENVVTNVKFYIIGSNPTEEVKSLEKNSNIIVTGRVDDIRQYVQYSHLAVAPLRIARGVQNKVIEALALRRQIVASSAATKGLKPFSDKQIINISDSEEKFSDLCIQILQQNPPLDNHLGRQYVESNYVWEKSLLTIEDALNND